MKLEDRRCVLCGPDAPRTVKYEATFSADDFNARVFSARRMPDKRHFRLVQCNGCGMIYSDPACDPSLLAKLYEKSAVTYERQEEQIYNSYAPILDRALQGLDHRKAFVEIGGGRGFMLRYGHEKSFASQVEIEPSADAERRFAPAGRKARFVRGIFGKGMLPPASASLVCFFQVLDHIPDPHAFLQAVHEVLAPGGAAVCVTHNTRAWSAKILGERSPIYDIEHTYLFDHHNLPRLFARAGFAEAESFPVANRYALRYWLHLAPMPRLLKRAALWTLERLWLADRKVNLRAGNFAVVARKAANASAAPVSRAA
jgi:SAM-dependent methyltransferase